MTTSTAKEFQLTIKICALVIYQAVIKLNELQYEVLLNKYRHEGSSCISGETGTVEDLTGKPFDHSRDYVKEAPDAILAALICVRVEGLFTGWPDFHPFKMEEAFVEVKQNNTEQFTWECVPMDGKIR